MQGEITGHSLLKEFPIVYRNIEPPFEKWINLAAERTFSIAAGDRIGRIAPKIMNIGFAKVLFGATQLGSDYEQAKPFVLFAPDGTCSYNPVRNQRGFSYGAMVNFGFDGMIATNNTMPNGCGFTMFELTDPQSDDQLCNYLTDSQMRLGQDQISQLSTGNHFAGIYYVLDPLSGEDTGRRFIVVHCSGHIGGNKLYHPDAWLEFIDGYNEIKTPHGPITFLEGEAKRRYLNQFEITDTANTKNRENTMAEIFPDRDWTTVEEITHQGLNDDGSLHKIGVQIHDGIVPIAFNPEEGLIAVKSKPNLSKNFLDNWGEGNRVKEFGLERKIGNLNFTPHGGGYEFRKPLDLVEIYLNREGVEKFSISIKGKKLSVNFNYFKEIRNFMSFRRKSPIIQEISKADLAEIKYEMPSLMQIYPLLSIPGGSH